MITYRMLEQYDDAGALYDAFTLEAYDDADNVTTWYENVVTGWAYGTPEVYNVALFTIAPDVPEDLGAWSLEDLDDDGREELATRAHALLGRPCGHDSRDTAAAAGLEYLGDFEVRHTGRPGVDPADEWAAALAHHLEAIGYDDVTSF